VTQNREIRTEYAHLAAIGGDLRRDEPEQRRLAGSARPHDGGDPSAPDLHVQTCENRPPATA